MIADEVAKDMRLLDHYKRCASVLLPICGRWYKKLPRDVMVMIIDLLLPMMPPAWHNYPDLDFLPYSPVMPYDVGHHSRHDFVYPGYALPDPAVWHTEGEDEWRMYVTRLSIDTPCRNLRVTRAKVKQSLKAWVSRVEQMRR